MQSSHNTADHGPDDPTQEQIPQQGQWQQPKQGSKQELKHHPKQKSEQKPEQRLEQQLKQEQMRNDRNDQNMSSQDQRKPVSMSLSFSLKGQHNGARGIRARASQRRATGIARSTAASAALSLDEEPVNDESQKATLITAVGDGGFAFARDEDARKAQLRMIEPLKDTHWLAQRRQEKLISTERKQKKPQEQQSAQKLVPALNEDDRVALRALEHDAATATGKLEYSKSGSTRTIEMSEPVTRRAPPAALNESENYKLDIAARPDEATLEDYKQTPVEEFGAALLRGMGWREGHAVGRSHKNKAELDRRELKQRPAFLGIGARELPSEQDEIGEWDNGNSSGKSSGRYAMLNGRSGQQSRRKKPDAVYVPLFKIDKATGHVVEETTQDDKQYGLRHTSKKDTRNSSQKGVIAKSDSAYDKEGSSSSHSVSERTGDNDRPDYKDRSDDSDGTNYRSKERNGSDNRYKTDGRDDYRYSGKSRQPNQSSYLSSRRSIH